jgi:hypothetical protein
MMMGVGWQQYVMNRERFIRLPFEERERERIMNIEMRNINAYLAIYNEPTQKEFEKLKNETI